MEFQQNLVRNLYNANCLPSANNQWFDDRTASPAQILHSNHSTQSGNGAGPYYTAPQSGCYDNTKLLVSNVAGNFFRDASSCPPLSTGGGGGGGGSQRTLSNILGNLNAGISVHKQNLNTEQNKLQAAGSHSLKALAAGNQDAVVVKDLLAQQGGLLSDSVLIAYFSNNFTPPGLAKEVHAQNAPVSAAVWQIIVNKNYPAGIFAQMQTAQNTNVTSLQQNQKQLINNIKTEIDYLFNEKLRLFLSDSLYRNADSVEANLLSSLYADKNEKLLDHYLHTKKFTQASSKLNQLSNANANQNYLQFKGDVLTALQHSLGLYSLNNNAAAKNRILNLANADFAKGQQQAQAIARLLWGNRYFEYTLLPEENVTSNSRELMTNNKVVENTLTDGSQLKLAPNPTADYCNIQYKLPSNSLTGKIIITDITGKQVQVYEVIASLSNIYFSTTNLKNGVYMVNLYCNNRLSQSSKLVIIK
ncbi:MAG: T9SS type A sorting domain-containing protein [Bacteroidia bacterium]